MAVVGDPRIFTPNRRLVREGEIERVRGSGGRVEIKKYYVHLFNDAFIYSQRNALSWPCPWVFPYQLSMDPGPDAC